MKEITGFLVALIMAYTGFAWAADNTLVVYSARKEHLVKDLFEKYEKDQGIKIQYITDDAAVLLQRIISEGENTPADLLLTVDVGNLWHAAQKNLLAPVTSEILEKNIPAHYQDPENRWFGLSLRARTIVYNTNKVTLDMLSTYQELAEEKWKGKLLLRTSKKVYNQSLVAMFIATQGEEATQVMVQGWVKNLATPPFSSDTLLLEALAAGQGEVGIVNTYYLGRLLKKNPELPLGVFWPDQADHGVHVNISGAGIVKSSQKIPEAIKFLEWLSEKDAQKILADANMEYPVNPEVERHAQVQAWGNFKESKLNLSKAGELQGQAIQLMDKAGYK